MSNTNKKPTKQQGKAARTLVKSTAPSHAKAVARGLREIAGLPSSLDGWINMIPDHILEKLRGKHPNDYIHRPSAAAKTSRRAGGPKGPMSEFGAMPNKFTSSIGPFYMKRVGKAQKDVDIQGKGDPEDSIRIQFSDMIPFTVQTDSTPHLKQVFYNGSTYAGGIALTPGSVSPKLGVMETLYDFYALRNLMIQYVPTVSTNAIGALALAVTSGPIEDTTFASGGLGPRQVLEHNFSCAGNVFIPLCLEYSYGGTKTFVTTSTGSPPVFEYIQAYLFGSLTAGLASTYYGDVVVSGTVDFYKTTEININPVLAEQRLWERFCYYEWLTYYHSPDYDGISARDFLRKYLSQIRTREARKLIHTTREPHPYCVDDVKSS